MVVKKNSNIFKIIARYLEFLRRNKTNFKSVYLFGSYAKGEAHEDSDIDLAIIADNWENDLFDTQFLLMRMGVKIDTRIEPHPFITEEFEETNPFVKDIMDNGIKIL